MSFDSANPEKFIDLHAQEVGLSYHRPLCIALEHGFRSIVVPLGQIEALWATMRQCASDCGDRPRVVAAFDWPEGAGHLDVRSHAVYLAKERGADEIEIVAPCHWLAKNIFSLVSKDMEAVSKASIKCNIPLKYVINLASQYMPKDVTARNNLVRFAREHRLPAIAHAGSCFDSYVGDYNDQMLWLREFRKAAGCLVKLYGTPKSFDEMIGALKGGIDLLGIDWKLIMPLVNAQKNQPDGGSQVP